ncbi:MAG TPA: hypothetical protein VGJ66_07810 [Pyrinomonadaceae bacterium]
MASFPNPFRMAVGRLRTTTNNSRETLTTGEMQAGNRLNEWTSQEKGNLKSITRKHRGHLFRVRQIVIPF